MEKFKQWYFTNYLEITWFVIGFMVAEGIADLGNHNYTGAAISFGLAALNYFLSKR
jgi:hypothetical protein